MNETLPPTEDSQRETHVLDFVKESTSHFDSSHNYEHAWKVYQSALAIMESIDPAFDMDLLMYSALLHDVCDHKYPQSIKREKLDEFIAKDLGLEKAADVNFIIDNVSFSKEDKARKGLAAAAEVPERLKLYLDAVRDADRLEAIGETGIARCIAFSETIGRNIPEEVIEHCHEKLLRLYEERFIVTDLGRKLAEPLHQVIVDYVAEHSHN